MKHPSGSSKKSFSIPDFEHRLSMYALAASAAGVGMLALTPSAEGKIVYTKANKTMGRTTRCILISITMGSPISI